MSHKQNRLLLTQRIFYGLPQISIVMLFTPLYIMQGIYVKHFGFSMTMIASLLLVSRLFDAIIDPIVGIFSDRLKVRTGRRKPTVLIGAAFFGLAAILLYIPPSTPSAVYVGVSLFLFFVGFTFFTIPHVAWGSEIAGDSHEKTILFGLQTAAGNFGLVLFFVMPLLPIFPSTNITPETIKYSVYLAILILIISLYFCLRKVPEGPVETANKVTGGVGAFQSVLNNKTFRILSVAFICSSFGLAMWLGMAFIYVDIYLGLGVLFSPISLLAYSMGIAASLCLTALSGVIGKKLTWSVGIVIGLAATLSTPYFSPENINGFVLTFLFCGVTGALVANEFLPRSILGDIVDRASANEEANYTATYFSVFLFIAKTAFALGGGVGMVVAASLGFEPTAEYQTHEGVFALALVIGWIPSVLFVLALVSINFLRLHEKKITASELSGNG